MVLRACRSSDEQRYCEQMSTSHVRLTMCCWLFVLTTSQERTKGDEDTLDPPPYQTYAVCTVRHVRIASGAGI